MYKEIRENPIYDSLGEVNAIHFRLLHPFVFYRIIKGRRCFKKIYGVDMGLQKWNTENVF